jgi:hypothetical protein
MWQIAWLSFGLILLAFAILLAFLIFDLVLPIRNYKNKG